MNRIERIDTVGQFLHVDRNLSVHPMAHRRGPPLRPEGLSVGLVTMEREWHRVHILEPTQLLHVTPGPGGEHRPPAAEAMA